MSTNPNSPIPTTASTSPTPPATPLTDTFTQPFVYILAPFELGQNFVDKVLATRNETAITFELLCATPSIPIIQPHVVDRITVRILHGSDMPFSLPNKSWIVERASDVADLRARSEVLNTTVSNFKATRTHPKRKDSEDRTLAVRYNKGWVNVVAQKGLGNPFLECVPMQMNAGEDTSKRAKIATPQSLPRHAPSSTQPTKSSKISNSGSAKTPSLPPANDSAATAVLIRDAIAQSISHLRGELREELRQELRQEFRQELRQELGAEIAALLKQSYAPLADTTTPITPSAPPTVDERLERTETALSLFQAQSSSINSRIIDLHHQSISVKSDVGELERKLSESTAPNSTRIESFQLDFASFTTKLEKVDQSSRRTDKNFRSVEVALNRARDGLVELEKINSTQREELGTMKRWAEARFTKMDSALSRDFGALVEAMEGGKAKIVELGAKVVELEAKGKLGSSGMATESSGVVNGVGGGEVEESEAKLERNRKVDERLGRLEENLKVLTAITQENRSSLSNSVADRKEYTEEYRTDREEITKLITTLSSNVTALQAQAVSYAKSNPTDQLEPNSEEPQRIADRFAKISEEITEYSSTLQTLRSEHDFFTAQHERESIRRKAERARISDEIAMHADVLSRFRDVTTREAASKAKNILSLSTTIHEVVPRVRAMEVHLREEAAGRTVGRPPWTPAPRIHFPLKLPSTTIQDTTAGSSSNGSNSASSAVVDGLPESSTSALYDNSAQNVVGSSHSQ